MTEHLKMRASQVQGGCLRQPIDTSNQDDSKYLESDRKLLEKYGKKALIEFGYFGVLDRLKRAGVTD